VLDIAIGKLLLDAARAAGRGHPLIGSVCS
jgi:hypothetical protein